MSAVSAPLAGVEREVWFLTGSQGLYGPGTLAQVAEQSQAIAGQLAAAAGSPVRVVWKPVLTDAAAIAGVVLAANADDACVGLIAWMHTFSPAKMWIAGLDLLRKPLLHLHTQANVELPWSSIDMDFMNLNRLARFGDNMRDVAVTEGDKVEAQLRFGVSVNTYGVNDLVEAVDSASDAAVSALVKEYA
uniref:L-arabinose isomerase family protein n=1 Tax=Streptomyces sp. NRRL F-5123 TaxID=1463856 RepID=UPI0005B833C6